MAAEMAEAHARFDYFRSSHEGLGVLIEEVTELSEAIHSNQPDAIAAEALQVAAVALRIAESMGQRATRQRSGAE